MKVDNLTRWHQAPELSSWLKSGWTSVEFFFCPLSMSRLSASNSDKRDGVLRWAKALNQAARCKFSAGLSFWLSVFISATDMTRSMRGASDESSDPVLRGAGRRGAPSKAEPRLRTPKLAGLALFVQGGAKPVVVEAGGGGGFGRGGAGEIARAVVAAAGALAGTGGAADF